MLGVIDSVGVEEEVICGGLRPPRLVEADIIVVKWWRRSIELGWYGEGKCETNGQ